MTQGSKIAGGNSARGRVDNDFYATDRKDTFNFLKELKSDGIFLDGKSILEPCAGAGHIIDVLKSELNDIDIFAYDLVSRRNDVIDDTDFLISDFDKYDVILTNPPFKLAREFINKSLELSNRYVMIFAKLQFLEGKSRLNWWKNEVPLRYVYVYSYRATPLRNGQDRDENGKKWSSTMAFAWYVFDKEYTGEPSVRWIGDYTNENN